MYVGSVMGGPKRMEKREQWEGGEEGKEGGKEEEGHGKGKGETKRVEWMGYECMIGVSLS